MADLTDYLDLLTSEHRDKPRFTATVSAIVRPLVEQMALLAGMPDKFDLDGAMGDQLDTVGQWVGISRHIRTPLTDVYFSLDTDRLGIEQGVWKGPHDPDTGLTQLDDDTYRLVIWARIGANHWDGTLARGAEILNDIFGASTHAFIEDHQDMSMTIGITGTIPSAVYLALLAGGYIPLKPEGVRVDYVIVTPVDGASLFGFDMENEHVAGFDDGAWGNIVALDC